MCRLSGGTFTPPTMWRHEHRDGKANLSRSFLLRRALLCFPCGRPPLSKADALCHFGTRGGVVRSHHGEIPRKPPLLAVLFRREAVSGQMALHRLVLLPVLEADDEVWSHRLFPGHRWLSFLRSRRRLGNWRGGQ